MKQITNSNRSNKSLISPKSLTVSLNKQRVLNAIILMSVILSGGVVSAEQAFAVTTIFTNDVSGYIDGVSGGGLRTDIRIIPVANAGSPITDVNVLVDFEKESFDDCTDPSTNRSYANEITMSLTSPLGTVVQLVDNDDADYTTYDNTDNSQRVTVTFDDSADELVGTTNDGLPINGTFYPVEQLSAFNGEDPTGDWIFTFGDNYEADYLCFYQVDLVITADDITADDITADDITEEKSGGGGCADCEAPTLGLDSNYKRIVENGFTYNGASVDAERFFTPYPLITANIGESNTAVFKIYENGGIQNIKHFSFAFGLASDDVISNSKAMIELDIDYDGTETVTVTDPKNALDNIVVTTNVVECMAGSTAECLEVTIQHRFRAPLDFNIVATDVWDQKRNGWQNYFNHGIEVVGESMNPPEEYTGINAGQIYHLTETSKTSAVDEFGNNWTLQYDTWMMDYIKAERLQDAPTEVFTRMHSEFAGYKETQIRDAIEQLLVLCPTCLDESYTDFDDSWSYDIPNVLEKLQNPEIQQRMILENQKAQEIMNYLLDPTSNK